MIVESNLIAVTDSGGCVLFIRDQGHLGLQFVILVPHGQYATTSLWQEDIPRLIEKLQRLHERNCLEAK